MNTKQIATIAAVIVIIVAAAAVAVISQNNGGEKKGGLYTLDADVVEVTMGGITASPKIVDSIESLYSDIYGELTDDTLTIEDAMADTAFWEKYCTYEPMITDNGDGAGFFQMLKQQTDVEGKECATDTLQAVLQAAESDWTKDKAYVRQTVAVFTSSDLSADDAGKEKAEKFAGAWEYVFKEKASAVDRAMLYVWTTDENKWKDIAYSVGSVALKKQGVRMYNDSFYDLPYWAACPQNDIERLKFIVRRSRK